jgi:23S rRNA (uracil1939-C5)-methyltransferase
LGRKKDQPLLEKVMITDIGAEGNAIARVGNMVVFVPMLVPGDIVDIAVKRKRKKYLEGSVLRFHEYSTHRIKAPCIHFGVCGGCKWQHLHYDLQLFYKEKQVRDNLERIAKAEFPEVRPIIGSSEIYRYRNKLEFTFSDRRWLTSEEIISDNDFSKEDAIGFHIPGLFDKVLDIRECLLQAEPSNFIRNAVREYAHKDRLTFFNPREQSGFMRNLIIRTSSRGDVMVIFVFFYEDRRRREGLMDYISRKFPRISSLLYLINSKRNDSVSDLKPLLYKGNGFLEEEMDGLFFRISPVSFYQTNSKQAARLYSVARDFASLKGNEIVYDLYTGTGTIANFIAGSAAKVIGLEYMEGAIKDAFVNSEINGIKNTCFFAGDIKTLFDEKFVAANGKPDVIITDPPRGGMHEDVIEAIINANPQRIIYISCNPATQARDINLLAGRYHITAVQPVDMFPHTVHVENIVLLEKIER